MVGLAWANAGVGMTDGSAVPAVARAAAMARLFQAFVIVVLRFLNCAALPAPRMSA